MPRRQVCSRLLLVHQRLKGSGGLGTQLLCKGGCHAYGTPGCSSPAPFPTASASHWGQRTKTSCVANSHDTELDRVFVNFDLTRNLSLRGGIMSSLSAVFIASIFRRSMDLWNTAERLGLSQLGCRRIHFLDAWTLFWYLIIWGAQQCWCTEHTCTLQGPQPFFPCCTAPWCWPLSRASTEHSLQRVQARTATF